MNISREHLAGLELALDKVREVDTGDAYEVIWRLYQEAKALSCEADSGPDLDYDIRMENALIVASLENEIKRLSASGVSFAIRAKDLSLVVFTSAIFFCLGWVTGADDVLFDCREVGATQFLGHTFMCEDAKQ